MMPHEYDREIIKLREMVISLEFRINSQRKLIDDLSEQIQYWETKNGQANTQDRERPEERTKGHKKASKDG